MVEPALTERFTAAFRAHASGVAVITADAGDGPAGLTASSVASVSLDPPALVYSLSTASGSAATLLGADTVVVHLLSDANADLARAFAVSGTPRFTAEMDWGRLPDGEPYLRNVASVLRARPIAQLPVGPATVVVAEVLEVLPGSHQGDPLVYHGRQFYSLRGAEAVA